MMDTVRICYKIENVCTLKTNVHRAQYFAEKSDVTSQCF